MFVDESGFSLIPYVAKTWAPVGQTPVLIHQGRCSKFSAISGVTPRSRLSFRGREGTIRGSQVIASLRHLLRHSRRRPILVCSDGGPHHRSKLVRAFLDTQPRLEVHRFPGYSPELNPDEWGRSHLKQHELASYAPRDVRELRHGVRLSVMRMRARPRLIRSFVAASHLFDRATECTGGSGQGRFSSTSVKLFCPASVKGYDWSNRCGNHGYSRDEVRDSREGFSRGPTESTGSSTDPEGQVGQKGENCCDDREDGKVTVDPEEEPHE